MNLSESTGIAFEDRINSVIYPVSGCTYPYGLKDSSIINFYDFCIFLDCCVLHDYVFMKSLNSEDFSGNMFLYDLINEGIIKFIDIELIDNKQPTNDFYENMKSSSIIKNEYIMSDPRSRYVRFLLTYWNTEIKMKYNEHDHDSFIDQITLKSTLGTLCEELRLESLFDIPLASTFSVEDIYKNLPPVDIELKIVDSLSVLNNSGKAYSDLVKNASYSLSKAHHCGEIFRLPPIALEVISRASKDSDIFSALMDIRKKYSGIRKIYKDACLIYHSDDISLSDKQKETKKMILASKSLINSDDIISMEVAVCSAKMH